MASDNVAIWTYPWDLADEGIGTVVDRVTTQGIGDLLVAATYHSGRFLLPHNPRRKVYFPESGSLYFDPSSDWYENSSIQPPVWDELPEGFWGRLSEQVHGRGGTVSAWCLGLHNSGIGVAHPHTAVRNVYGDVIHTNLCAANPAVIDLLRNTVSLAALATNADRILLESFEYMPLRHGYHHEVIGVPVSTTVALLLTLCFCEWCAQNGMADNIDMARLKSDVRSYISSELEDPYRPAQPFDWSAFLDGISPQLDAYWQIRSRTVSNLLRAVVGDIRSVSDARIGILDFGPQFGTPIHGSVWQSGLDLEVVADLADEIHPTFYLTDPDGHRESIDSYLAIVPESLQIRPALRAILPQVVNEHQLRRSVEPLEGRVNGVSFYNYGFMGLDALNWIGRTVAESDLSK